ncbi:response regulator transcription factor [Cohnella nanjingensis]|uniref:Response regulator transcription factor n=1 Tax=Cohnella nanjingensis TaxID=1387779 RepID=A0A7X0VFF8_9BACL|nr:response regulator transcription factor [Cohnella nanjingensis]MBB6670569.1 response regulator transcription factor [Cohnella nanjingensis]
MYSVLIVDDESTIREGLEVLIEWESLGFRVAGAAANAKEAIPMYRDCRPDLMIVDIRMPGMNGLELVQHLRRENERQHVLVLSGYADFSYAKRAIQLGIDGYLLKPVDEEELAACLAKMKEVLDEERRAEGEDARQAVWSREMLVQALVANRFAGEGERLRMAADQAGLSWQAYQVVLLHLQPEDPQRREGLPAVLARLDRALARGDGGFVFQAEPYSGLLLKSGLSSDSAKRNLLREIGEASEAEGCEYVAAAGGGVSRLEDLAASFAAALERLHNRFFYDVSMLIDGDTPTPQLPAASPMPDAAARLDDIKDRLLYTIEAGNKAPLSLWLEEAGRYMLLAGEGESGIKARFGQLLTGVLNKLSQKHAIVRERFPSYEERVLAAYRAPSYRTMLLAMSSLLEEVSGEIACVGSESRIRQMIDLIHRNYQENLKLESLADALGYNSAYLGKLFRNTTGDPFNTYLDKVRIEKAKELLDAGMKVYEVAERVGYTQADYFRGKFQKYVGVPPTSYRKK